MGRPRTATHLKLLRGNPGKQALGPEAEAPILEVMPEPPAWLEEVGQAEWRRVVGLLFRMRILSEVDLEPLAGYCRAVEVRRRAVEATKKDGRALIARGDNEVCNPLIAAEREASKAVLRHAEQFGFTPVARSRINPTAAARGTKFGNLVEVDHTQPGRQEAREKGH